MDWWIRRSFNWCHFSGEPLVVFTTSGSHLWSLPGSSTRQSHQPSRRDNLDCQRSVSYDHQLLTNSSPSFRRWLHRSPPFAHLRLNAIVYHQDVTISHMCFHWLTWDMAEEGGDLVGNQQFFEINSLGRFDERWLRIAWAYTLIVEVESAVCSDGGLLKLNEWRLLKKMNTPPVKTKKLTGCHF